MRKILFIVSTLQRSGPTTQLYNLIRHLDRVRFEPWLITLSPESEESMWDKYELLGVRMCSLNLSRLGGVFASKSKIKKIILEIKPDVIHTQGLRADSLLARMNVLAPRVATIRNFPPDDYLTKFKGLKGKLMVREHFSAMHKTTNLIACSKTICSKLRSVSIASRAIQNGVEISLGDKGNVPLMNDLKRPIFISVGSLIPRKNMSLVIDAFKLLPQSDRGSLVILGDGFLKKALESELTNDIHLLGDVGNVCDYLAGADYFVSASLSEGLPNTVLEALAAGLPVILSDIDSHREIAVESNDACKIFSLEEGLTELCVAMRSVREQFNENATHEAKRLANEVFSAKIMSEKYQEIYTSLVS